MVPQRLLSYPTTSDRHALPLSSISEHRATSSVAQDSDFFSDFVTYPFDLWCALPATPNANIRRVLCPCGVGARCCCRWPLRRAIVDHNRQAALYDTYRRILS